MTVDITSYMTQITQWFIPLAIAYVFKTHKSLDASHCKLRSQAKEIKELTSRVENLEKDLEEFVYDSGD